MNFKTEPVTRETAQKLLRQFLCVDQLHQDQIPGKEEVQTALLFMREHSDYQILGICANSAEDAIAALYSYLIAFGLSKPSQPALVHGAVYLKYNPKTGLCYMKPYEGTHRGVLVSCQSAYDGDVNETFGHLPLDLFSEII